MKVNTDKEDRLYRALVRLAGSEDVVREVFKAHGSAPVEVATLIDEINLRRTAVNVAAALQEDQINDPYDSKQIEAYIARQNERRRLREEAEDARAAEMLTRLNRDSTIWTVRAETGGSTGEGNGWVEWVGYGGTRAEAIAAFKLVREEKGADTRGEPIAYLGVMDENNSLFSVPVLDELKSMIHNCNIRAWAEAHINCS